LDTTGRAEVRTVRLLCYHRADVFVVCFSIGNRNSLTHIKTKWVGEIRECARDRKIFLVGMEADIRKLVDDPVLSREGQKMAEDIDALCSAECAAPLGDGIGDVFASAVGRARARSGKRCSVQEIINPPLLNRLNQDAGAAFNRP
jgi:GTPase SAR1 family protein